MFQETASQINIGWAKELEEVLITPALLFNVAGIRRNLLRMIDLAGDPSRLMPHVKTHKCAEVIDLQLDMGLSRFKCSTIAEAELLGACGAEEVLLAYPLVGPSISRFISLIQHFPKTKFATLVDQEKSALRLIEATAENKVTLEVWIDIDSGMGRTGIRAGDRAFELFRLLDRAEYIKPVGLHHYDGHLTQSDPSERKSACDQAFQPTLELAEKIHQETERQMRIIAGGSPTFPIHALRDQVELSPGTTLLWDAGYTARFPDLPFEVAALVGTRVVSHPDWDRLCLDLGHKAIAAENQPPRVIFPQAPNLREAIHSEEHLAMVGPEADQFEVGNLLLGSPRHICPTVALYQEAMVLLEDGTWDVWKIRARDRRLTH